MLLDIYIHVCPWYRSILAIFHILVYHIDQYLIYKQHIAMHSGLIFAWDPTTTTTTALLWLTVSNKILQLASHSSASSRLDVFVRVAAVACSVRSLLNNVKQLFLACCHLYTQQKLSLVVAEQENHRFRFIYLFKCHITNISFYNNKIYITITFCL